MLNLIRRILRIHWPALAARVPFVLGGRPVAKGVTVSLTTHGARTNTVHAAIYSILRGRLVPESLVLVLNSEPTAAVAIRTLGRLKKHGLEVLIAPNFGPHTKYYPIVSDASRPLHNLVTADDDIFYPRDWLARLVATHEAHPDDVICWWAKEMRMGDGVLLSYQRWPNASNFEPRKSNFALGVGGVLYPRSMIEALRSAGTAFQDCCARADDIWLHATALRSGHRVRPIVREFTWPILIPDTQEQALKHDNHRPDGNDLQMTATYTAADLDGVRQELAALGQSV